MKTLMFIIILLLAGCSGNDPHVDKIPESEMKNCIIVAGNRNFDIYKCEIPGNIDGFPSYIYCGYEYAGYGPALSCTR